MLRWVGAILMGLGLVLGASAVDRLPSMRLDTWESATVSLVPGAEVRLDYSHGMKGGRAVRLLVDAPEGYLALPDAPELTVTWWRRAGALYVRAPARWRRGTCPCGFPRRPHNVWRVRSRASPRTAT